MKKIITVILLGLFLITLTSCSTPWPRNSASSNYNNSQNTNIKANTTDNNEPLKIETEEELWEDINEIFNSLLEE